MKMHLRIVFALVAIALCIGLLPMTSVQAASTVNIMSYNLKNTNYSFSSVSSMISTAGAEIIGMQEVTFLQYPLLSVAMSNAGYSAIKGNDRNDGEHAPIFYKTSKFTLLRSGCYWLSDTPTVESKFDESSYYRICTWGYFQIKNTSDYLIIFNTHLDFGAALVYKQINVILNDIIVKTSELTNAKHHVVVTGDFNAASNTVIFKYILGDTAYNSNCNVYTKQRLDESRQIASKVVSNSFGNNYTQPAEGPTADIDHILVTSEGFNCTYYQVLSDAAGSDHLPILAKLTYKTATHNYDYQWKSNGTHSVSCAHCGYSATSACTVTEDHCTLCGGGGTEKFRKVTNQSDLTTGRYIMVIAATGTYTGSSAYYSVGLKQDSGFKGLVSYGLGFTELPDTISLSNGDNAKMVWNLEGDASGFTLHNVSDKALYYGGNNDLLFGRYTPTQWTGVMSTTTFHFIVKCNSSIYFSLRTDLNTLGHSDVNSPLVTCAPNASTGNYRVYFYKKYEECRHTNTATSTTPATCTSDGSVVITCNDCGEEISCEVIAASGHTYNAVVTAPTCTTGGYTTYTCGVCGDSYTGNAVGANGHSYQADVTEPTCTQGGCTVYTCAVCKDTYQDDETAALGHDYVAEETLPSCTQAGKTIYTCSRCGDSYEEEAGAASGHSYQVKRTEPTCIYSGEIAYTCSACGKTYSEMISALGHDYKTVVTPPTCTKAGKSTHTCERCGDTYSNNYVSATGHSYVATTTPPTCSANGSTVYTCTICSSSYTKVLQMTGHTYTETVIPATCTSDGSRIFTCTACSHSYSEALQTIDHTYAVTTTSPTCTQSGKTTYTCTMCGDCYFDNEVEAVGHTYDTQTVAPTCTQAGFTIYTCEACGDQYQSNVTPALEHSYISETTASTCLQAGKTTYTCTRCGVCYEKEIPKLSHVVTAFAEVQATCTTGGNVPYYECVLCEKYFIDPEAAYEIPASYIWVPAEGHACVFYSDLDPTCTQDGRRAHYYCKSCEGYFFDANGQYTAPKDYICIAATGHAYTYTDNGENHTVGCENCNLAETADHNYVDGACVCGAVESTEPVLKPDSNLAFSMSITVGAEMQVVYTVLASKVSSYESFYLEVSKNVTGGEPVVTTYGLDEGMSEMMVLTNASGKISGYRATYTGINAKEMGDEFTATLYAVAADGTIYYSNANTNSIKSFLMGKITDTVSPATLKTLAVDMLNYGAAAQLNFSYDAENLVNADLTEEQKALGTQVNPESVDSTVITGDGINLTASVTLKSKVELTLTCMYKTEDASNVKFIFKDKDGNVLAELAPTKHIANKAVQCVYDQVGAKQMRELITIEVYDGDTLVSKTLTWSVESYVAATLAKTTTSEILANMVNAMLIYGDSAAAYLA